MDPKQRIWTKKREVNNKRKRGLKKKRVFFLFEKKSFQDVFS
jgi:hypothetical protein